MNAFKKTKIQKREKIIPRFFVPIVSLINEILMLLITNSLSKISANIIIQDKSKILILGDKLNLSSKNPNIKILISDIKKIFN